MGKWKFINIVIATTSFVFMILVLYNRYEVEPVVYFYILGGIVVCTILLLFIYYPLMADSKIIKKIKSLWNKTK